MSYLVGVQSTAACVAYAKQAYIGYKIEKERDLAQTMPKSPMSFLVGSTRFPTSLSVIARSGTTSEF